MSEHYLSAEPTHSRWWRALRREMCSRSTFSKSRTRGWGWSSVVTGLGFLKQRFAEPMSVANFVADPQYIQQAFATSEPFFARQAGIETRVLLISDAGYNPYRRMFTTRDFLGRHPEIVARFVRASLKGWRDYLNDPTAAHAMIAKLNPALNPEWMQFTWQAWRDGRFVTGDDPSGIQLGQMTSERRTTMYKQLYDLKVIDKAFDPATAYTLQFNEKK